MTTFTKHYFYVACTRPRRKQIVLVHGRHVFHENFPVKTCWL